MKDGSVLDESMSVANAHPLGATPWKRDNYIRKFEILTEGIIDPVEGRRFLDLVQRLPNLRAEEMIGINVALPAGKLLVGKKGIF